MRRSRLKNNLPALMRTVVALGLVTGLGQFAKAEVINFNDQTAGTSMANGGSITEGDFTITSIFTGDPGNYVTFANLGSVNGIVDGNNQDEFGTLAEITLTGGGTFQLNSLDVADLYGNGATVFCGFGSRIEVTNDLGSCLDYGPGSTSLTTETVGIDGITTLDINLVSVFSNNFAVTNINLTPDTPEPATLWLAGIAGLAGLAARKRFLRA
jgi:hypothetical protein